MIKINFVLICVLLQTSLFSSETIFHPLEGEITKKKARELGLSPGWIKWGEKELSAIKKKNLAPQECIISLNAKPASDWRHRSRWDDHSSDYSWSEIKLSKRPGNIERLSKGMVEEVNRLGEVYHVYKTMMRQEDSCLSLEGVLPKSKMSIYHFREKQLRVDDHVAYEFTPGKYVLAEVSGFTRSGNIELKVLENGKWSAGRIIPRSSIEKITVIKEKNHADFPVESSIKVRKGRTLFRPTGFRKASVHRTYLSEDAAVFVRVDKAGYHPVRIYPSISSEKNEQCYAVPSNYMKAEKIEDFLINLSAESEGQSIYY